jgi:hypothetical protein
LEKFLGRLLLALATVLPAALNGQTFQIRPAPEVDLPGPVDSNSPAHWSNGNFVLFNSEGSPFRSEGTDQFSLSATRGVTFLSRHPSPIWIEATLADDNGVLFAWYHHEPGGLCKGSDLTAPKIGALVSYDNGATFQDLGFILQSGDPVDCSAQNGYFAGGNGDFTVIADADHNYLYFLFSNYGGDVSSQGVAVARMAYSDRYWQQGAVWKYYNGDFTEVGLGGRVTPIFPASVSWMQQDTDAYWGPSVHWNTALQQYVMLLNHSCCSTGWPQEGIYVSSNPDLANPAGWSAPQRVLDGFGWYPQVIGEDPAGTDKIAGAASRLYVYGISAWELVVNPTPPDTPTLPDSQ